MGCCFSNSSVKENSNSELLIEKSLDSINKTACHSKTESKEFHEINKVPPTSPIPVRRSQELNIYTLSLPGDLSDESIDSWKF